MNKKEILIKKASGEVVSFSEKKLAESLRRSGASEAQIDFVIDQMKDKIVPGMSTKKIHRIAFSILKKSSPHIAARYHLKKGIMELGPSGYPFEKFIGAIIEQQGYKTSVGVVLAGQCVNHEVDVVAESATEYILVECKYHNLPGIVCDVKIPLYIHSRFRDIAHKMNEEPHVNGRKHNGWVVTNTRFTSDAVQYGTCAGLYLLGWDYPAKNNLRELIDRMQLYPLTCLTSLSKPEKERLLEKQVVLSKELLHKPELLDEIGLGSGRKQNVLNELTKLCCAPDEK